MCSVCASSAVKGRGATKGPLEPGSLEGVTRRLTEIVWHYTFMHHFWMKQGRQNKATEASSPHQ